MKKTAEEIFSEYSEEKEDLWGVERYLDIDSFKLALRDIYAAQQQPSEFSDEEIKQITRQFVDQDSGKYRHVWGRGIEYGMKAYREEMRKRNKQ